MTNQNRTFHVLRKPDILICYEQRAEKLGFIED